MIVGTPVLAVDSGGHSEIVCDGINGWLAPPDDVKALSRSALNILCDRNMRTKVAETAREFAKANYDIGRHALKVMALYDKIV